MNGSGENCFPVSNTDRGHFELWYEELEAMRDETGACYFEGTSYFAVITNYGARIEISKEDARFSVLEELLRSDVNFYQGTAQTTLILQNCEGLTRVAEAAVKREKRKRYKKSL